MGKSVLSSCGSPKRFAPKQPSISAVKWKNLKTVNFILREEDCVP